MDTAKKTFFDTQNQRFFNSIYKTAKGEIRLAVLKRDLEEIVRNGKNLNILDIGGGGGQMAIWAASFGHRVKIIDISEEMLKKAQKNIELSPDKERISLQKGDILELILNEKFELIFCHAVLEWVEEGESLIRKCENLLKKGGFLSLLYYNFDALFFIHNVFANFDYLDNNLKSKKAAKLTPKYPKTISWVEKNINLDLKKRSGVRVFYDYMKDKDKNRHSLEEIIKREVSLSENNKFFNIARYIHDIYY